MKHWALVGGAALAVSAATPAIAGSTGFTVPTTVFQAIYLERPLPNDSRRGCR